MLKLWLTFFLSSAVYLCPGQTTKQLDKDTTYFSRAPLFIIQSQLGAALQASGVTIDPKQILAINIQKDSASKADYGEIAHNGVIIFTTRQAVSLSTLHQLLFANKIADEDLPVFIDSAISYKPNNYLFDQTAVKSVTVATEKESGMQYINITTRFPVPRLKSDEINIK